MTLMFLVYSLKMILSYRGCFAKLATVPKEVMTNLISASKVSLTRNAVIRQISLIGAIGYLREMLGANQQMRRNLIMKL
jgi:hypothetical protein